MDGEDAICGVKANGGACDGIADQLPVDIADDQVGCRLGAVGDRPSSNGGALDERLGDQIFGCLVSRSCRSS